MHFNLFARILEEKWSKKGTQASKVETRRCLKFFWDGFRIDLLQDGVVQVLESEEGRDEHGAEADGQHDAHEAAVNHSVDAVPYRHWYDGMSSAYVSKY